MSVIRENAHREIGTIFDTRYCYLYSLNLKLNVPMLCPSIELRVPVDVIHGGDVVSNQGQYFLSSFLHVVMQLRRRTQVQYL